MLININSDLDKHLQIKTRVQRFGDILAPLSKGKNNYICDFKSNSENEKQKISIS